MKNNVLSQQGRNIFFKLLSFSKHATVLLLLLAGICCSCDSGHKNPGSLQKVSQMPPAAKDKKYISIDPSLLATGKDLVCNMTVKNKIADTAIYKEKIYGFCGTGCKEAFVAEPLTYINSIH